MKDKIDLMKELINDYWSNKSRLDFRKYLKYQ